MQAAPIVNLDRCAPRAALAAVPEATVVAVEDVAPLLLSLQRAGTPRTGTR